MSSLASRELLSLHYYGALDRSGWMEDSRDHFPKLGITRIIFRHAGNMRHLVCMRGRGAKVFYTTRLLKSRGKPHDHGI